MKPNRAPGGLQTPRDEQLRLRFAVVMFVLLLLSYVINAMDRQVFPVLLPAVTDELGITLGSAGFLSTIFTIGIAVAAVPAGTLADRYSRKTLILFGIVVYSVFTLLTALMPEYWSMLGVRAVTGVGEGVQQAALFAAAASYFYRNRALAIGFVNAGFGLGGAIGPFFGSRLFASTGSWRVPLYGYGGLGLVMAIVIFFAVSKRFTESEAARRNDTTWDVANARVAPNFLNRNLVLGTVAAVATGFAMFGFIALYPTFLETVLDFSSSTAGTAASMFGIGAMLGIPAGYLGDRLSVRWMDVAGFTGVIISSWLLFFIVTTGAGQYALALAFGAFGSGVLFVNTQSLMQRSVKTNLIGRATGLFLTSLYGASALSGYTMGALVDGFGWHGGTAIQLMVVPVIGIIAVLLVDRKLMLPKVMTNVDK